MKKYSVTIGASEDAYIAYDVIVMAESEEDAIKRLEKASAPSGHGKFWDGNAFNVRNFSRAGF